MADTVQVTAGSGTVIGTDEVTIGGTAQHVQRIKLVDGSDGGTDLIGGSAARGLYVDPRLKVARIQVVPTISTTAYTAKDNVGGLMTFANAVRTSGGSCSLQAVQIVDQDQERVAIDMALFRASITAPTDNAIFAPTDAELDDCVGVVNIVSSDYADFSTNSIASKQNLGLSMTLAGTDLFVALVARTAMTYTSTSDLTVTLVIDQD